MFFLQFLCHTFSKTFPHVHRKFRFSFVHNFSLSGKKLFGFLHGGQWLHGRRRELSSQSCQDVKGETAHVQELAKPKQKAEVKKTAKKNQQNKKQRSRQTPEEKKTEIALIRMVLKEKTKWQALQQIYKADKEKTSRWMRNVLPVVFTTSWTRKTTGRVRNRCTNSL